MNRPDTEREVISPVVYGARVFGTCVSVVGAIVGLFLLPVGVMVRVLIIGFIVMLVVSAVSFRVGRQKATDSGLKTVARNESSVIRTYEQSQHPDFFAHAKQLAGTAKNITLIATGLNLLWNEQVAGILIERAIARDARVTVCMGHHRNPHVLDRLIEEHMDESCTAAGSDAPRQHASFVRGASNVKALVERLEKAGNPNYFEVLLFAHYPTFAILIFDDQIFIYPYAYKVSGTYSPVLQIKDGSPEAEFFKEHARRVLNDAVPARDVVKARQDSRFSSTEWKSAAVFAIPEPDTQLYQAGSAVLGYDIWRGAEIFPSDELSYIRQYVGGAANSGFHLTLADALFFCNSAMIERVKAELRWLAEQFSPVSLASIYVDEDIRDPTAAVLRASDNSGTLEALHHELVSRVYGIAISSGFRVGREQYPQHDARARLMVQRYGAPNILGAFAPHFPLCSAMPTESAARKRIMEDLKSATAQATAEKCELSRIVLAIRDSVDGRWRILDHFRLDG